jgi:hypothetical protein
MTDLEKLKADYDAARVRYYAAAVAYCAAYDAAARDAADAAMTDDLREAVARALAKADNVNGVGWVIYLPKADAALTVARSITFDAANDAYRDALAAQEKETEQ